MLWKVHCHDTFIPRREYQAIKCSNGDLGQQGSPLDDHSRQRINRSVRSGKTILLIISSDFRDPVPTNSPNGDDPSVLSVRVKMARNDLNLECPSGNMKRHLTNCRDEIYRLFDSAIGKRLTVLREITVQGHFVHSYIGI